MRWLCDDGECIRTRTHDYPVPCASCAGYRRKDAA